jgi:poly(A) polymerase
MVDAHLRPLLIAREGAPSLRSVRRFFRDTDDAAVDTLFLSLADHVATTGPRVTIEGWRRHVAVVAYIIATELEREEQIPNVKLISGEDLMAEFNLDPGPLVGELLAAIQEAQELGSVSTKEEALELAGQHLARKRVDRT